MNGAHRSEPFLLEIEEDGRTLRQYAFVAVAGRVARGTVVVGDALDLVGFAPEPRRVMLRHIAISTSAPIDRTVFTDVCTIIGERSSTAAASTASRVRSLTMLIAATPYRSANARSTICLSGTTGTGTSGGGYCHAVMPR